MPCFAITPCTANLSHHMQWYVFCTALPWFLGPFFPHCGCECLHGMTVITLSKRECFYLRDHIIGRYWTLGEVRRIEWGRFPYCGVTPLKELKQRWGEQDIHIWPQGGAQVEWEKHLCMKRMTVVLEYWLHRGGLIDHINKYVR